ncbi:BglG family transcription antiterminator [Bacillus tianshenii]|nr:BglG family transcription antiterminator [Bacillus tianshenii]
MIDERCTVILSKLIQAEEEYVSIKQLTETLGVSRRTLYYDFEKINSWLSDHQLKPISRVARKGLYLEKETKQRVSQLINHVDDWQYNYTKNERQLLMIIEILTSKTEVFTTNLTDLTKVSRGTIASDLKELKEMLSEMFNLTLAFHRFKGYKVSGREFDQRKAFTHSLDQLLVQWEWKEILEKFPTLFHPQDDKELIKERQQILSMISASEQSLGIELTSEMLSWLALQLLILKQRVQAGHPIVIDDDEKEALKDTQEYQAAEELLTQFKERAKITIPADEVYFITIHLLGAKVNYSNFDMDKNREMKRLKQVVLLMVNDFENYACIMFKEKKELVRTLFMHVKPAYYRIKYGVTKSNNVADSVSMKYPEIFKLTEKVVEHLEKLLHQRVSKSEIAYIAMHFGGWMKREGKTPLPRTRAIIVCENGIGTSAILRGQLEHLLSTVDIVDNISLRQYQQKNYDVDVIFSTSPIKENHVPVIMVNPILTDAEKESLLMRFNAFKPRRNPTKTSISTMLDVIRRYADIKDDKQLRIELERLLRESPTMFPKEYEKPMLNELLTDEMIQVIPRVKNWEDAIQEASKPLIEKNYITEKYVRAMIDNINNLGPYIVIAPKIAIPHARPEEGVNRLGMSLLLVEESVKFSEDAKHDANLIIVLAAIDNETHLKALSQLTDLLSDEKSLNQLLKIKSSEEGVELINNHLYSHEEELS